MSSSYFVTYGGNRVTFGGVQGPVAWEFEHPMVVLFPGATTTYDYLKMRFVTPDSQEIILEAGSGTTASASARVPVGSTAYWTGNGYQGNTATKWHVSSLYNSGFSGVSANTAVTTSFYENPNSAANGSAVLTATGSATATVATHRSYLVTFGGGGTNYHASLSASSFAGNYLSPLGNALRTAWIPSGGNIRFSASSNSGQTYSIQSITVNALSATSISWAHTNPGTNMLLTGKVTAAGTQCRLGNGRQKLVYATGYNRVLWAAAGLVSAASWQPHNIITAFSSNLCSGTASDSFIVGSGNAGKIRGFNSSTTVGSMCNSAGTWSNPASGNTYKWTNRYFMSNSAHVTATFSAVRSKGPTANNNATYVFYGRNTAGNSVSRLSAQFALPKQSGKTATKTASGNFSTTTFQDEAYALLSNTVAKSTALFANAVGYFTASGRVQ